MILYHFTTSPFARRVRLTLALKGLSAELRDARADPEHAASVKSLNPLHTVPVLIDGERVICDSNAICQYLDRKFVEPPLWPAGLAGAEAFEYLALSDSVINTLSDMGMRYAPIHDAAQFHSVREQLIGRVQRALDTLARRVAHKGQEPLCAGSWSGADIALYTTVAWLSGMPARAATFPAARAVLSLGWSLPPELLDWAEQQRSRADVAALG